MDNCNQCGKKSVIPTHIGDVCLCKKCYLKANGLTWAKKNYKDAEDLKSKKEKAKQCLEKAGFNETVKTKIDKFFQKEIDEGFIFSIDGSCGQILKLYKNYCIIITDDTFSTELYKDDFRKGKAGISGDSVGAVISDVKNMFNEAVSGSKVEFSVMEGERKISFADCRKVKYIKPTPSLAGFFNFILDSSDLDVPFFFRDATDMPGKYSKTKSTIDNYKANRNASKTDSQSIDSTVKEDPVELIKKYKQLLDDKAITQEEYDRKKAQLLGEESNESKKEVVKLICSYCGSSYPSTFEMCPHCNGMKDDTTEIAVERCPSCGAIRKPGKAFCTQCGYKY